MTSKIVGGTTATAARYPYMAAILIPNEAGGNNLRCGGVLVSPTLVLTTASCLTLDAISLGTQVALGCENLATLDNNDCEVIQAIATVIHPDFDEDETFVAFGFSRPVSTRNLGVIQLSSASVKEPITIFNSGVSDLENGFPVQVNGWGVFDEQNSVTAFLQEAEMEAISRESCAAQFSDWSKLVLNDPIAEVFFSLTNFCTVGDNQGPCQFDQGGPALLNCGTADTDVLLGIFTGQRSCSNDGFPAVFAKVDVDFIKDVADFFGELDEVLETTSVERCGDPLTGPLVPINDEAPTSFPTVGGFWNCSVADYGTHNGCHCGCGAPDPDCVVMNRQEDIIGCPVNEEFPFLCEVGLCVSTAPTESPVDVPTAEPDAAEGGDLLIFVAGGAGACFLFALIGSLFVVLLRKRSRTKRQKSRTGSGIMKNELADMYADEKKMVTPSGAYSLNSPFPTAVNADGSVLSHNSAPPLSSNHGSILSEPSGVTRPPPGTPQQHRPGQYPVPPASEYRYSEQVEF